MTGTVNLKLVSAPPRKRTCGFCGGPMFAIERWHGCPERRLELGLQRLRISSIEASQERRSAIRPQRRASKPPS